MPLQTSGQQLLSIGQCSVPQAKLSTPRPLDWWSWRHLYRFNMVELALPFCPELVELASPFYHVMVPVRLP